MAGPKAPPCTAKGVRLARFWVFLALFQLRGLRPGDETPHPGGRRGALFRGQAGMAEVDPTSPAGQWNASQKARHGMHLALGSCLA